MRTRRSTALVAILVAFGLLMAACSEKKSSTSGSSSDSGGSAASGTLKIVPADFPESKTLAQVYGQYLEAKGYKVDIQPPAGQREDVFPKLKDGSADLEIEYSGSTSSYLAPDSAPSADPAKTYDRLKAAITSSKSPVVALDYATNAEDKNAVVVTTAFADKNNVKSLSDLVKVQDQVTLGGSAQCPDRADCLAGYKKVYGLDFASRFKPLEYGPPLAAALESNDVQAAVYQTTAPEIATGKFVALEDDKGLASADSIVPIISTKAAKSFGSKLTDDINALTAKLTTKDITNWNKSTDIDKEEPADVAKQWLTDKGLLK